MQIKSRIQNMDFFFFFGNVGPGNIGKLGGATWIWDGRCEIFPLVDRLSRDVKKIGKMKFSVKDHKVVCECLSIYKSYDTVYYDINSDNQFRYMRNLISFIEQPLSFFFFSFLQSCSFTFLILSSILCVKARCCPFTRRTKNASSYRFPSCLSFFRF